MSGSDSNSGTQAQPFLTVQKAINTAQPGDTVRVGAGTYSQDVRTARSGTSNAPIILDGQGVATVQSMNMQHQYVHLLDFTITGRTNRFSSLLYMGRGAHHCVISNNTVDGNFTPNVFIMGWNTPTTLPFGEEAASDTLVVSNTFTHGLACPMISMFGDRNVIKGNRLLDSGVVDWFRLWGRSNHIVGNVCSNNFLTNYSNHPDFIQTFGNNGHGSRWHVIERNLVTGIESGQLMMLTADRMTNDIRDWTFRNNIFVDVAAGGPVCIPGVAFYNNLFLRCNTTNGGHVMGFSSYTYGTNGTDYPHGGRVLNNVFLNCGDSRTNVGWYYFQTNLVDVAADYNYVGKLGYKPVRVDPQHRAIGDPRSWDYMCMAWWEPHGINGGNPLFVNESNLDFRLKEGSPLIGAALPLNHIFTSDMRGTTRGAQWDIGPLEFQAGEVVLRPEPPAIHPATNLPELPP